MDVNATVLPSLMDARHMETVLVLTKLVLSGATSLSLVQPALTPGVVAFTVQGSQEESGHMKPVPLQLYLSITIINTTTVFNVMDKTVISVLHTSIMVDLDSTMVVLDSTMAALDSTMVDLDSTTVVQDTTMVVLGEDAATVDLVDPDLILAVAAPGGDATILDLVDLDSTVVMVVLGEDATMVALDSMVGAPVGDATMVVLDSTVGVTVVVLLTIYFTTTMGVETPAVVILGSTVEATLDSTVEAVPDSTVEAIPDSTVDTAVGVVMDATLALTDVLQEVPGQAHHIVAAVQSNLENRYWN
jgi:hypothetical protein